MKPIFYFSSSYSFDRWSFDRKIFFQKYWFLLLWPAIKKKFCLEKLKKRASKLCAEFNADSKTVLVFILVLIVFDFYSFEGLKTHFIGEPYI